MPDTASAALVLPDEVKALVNNALADGAPLLLAAVDAEGRPLLSYRGSIQVSADDQLGMWARNAQGGTLAAIRANPNVALMYRSATTPMLKFAGRARVVEDAAERARIYAAAPEREQKGDPDCKGAAVVIDLDKVEGVLRISPEGPVFCRLSRA